MSLRLMQLSQLSTYVWRVQGEEPLDNGNNVAQTVIG